MPTDSDSMETERDLLLFEIAGEYEDTARWTGKTEISPRVQAAMRKVPRHRFVPADQETFAYANIPLPIGHGQTISQPYIVAIMTDLLELTPEANVLEVGTGCGYQAAVLAEIAKSVFTIEYVPELADGAARRLEELGYANITVRSGNGYDGWPEHAPYDGIIVTCAAPEVPPPLFAQLKPGGRMVIPIGPPFSAQDLVLITKDEKGKAHEKTVLPVAFVPLVRDGKGAKSGKDGAG